MAAPVADVGTELGGGGDGAGGPVSAPAGGTGGAPEPLPNAAAPRAPAPAMPAATLPLLAATLSASVDGPPAEGDGVARGLSPDVLHDLVMRNTEGRTFGVLGEDRVNVLKLNLALDAASAAK